MTIKIIWLLVGMLLLYPTAHVIAWSLYESEPMFRGDRTNPTEEWVFGLLGAAIVAVAWPFFAVFVVGFCVSCRIWSGRWVPSFATKAWKTIRQPRDKVT